MHPPSSMGIQLDYKSFTWQQKSCSEHLYHKTTTTTFQSPILSQIGISDPKQTNKHIKNRKKKKKGILGKWTKRGVLAQNMGLTFSYHTGAS